MNLRASNSVGFAALHPLGHYNHHEASPQRQLPGDDQNQKRIRADTIVNEKQKLAAELFEFVAEMTRLLPSSTAKTMLLS
jgi:hypothetical protein